MKFSRTSITALAAAATLGSPVSAHSWVEYAFKLARNGTMVGKIGFPRGYVARDSTNPPFTDTIPQNILPAAGQHAYSGDEVLNKFQLNKNPEHPLLEASPGDYIAVMHLENGHTTLPQNQPNKPKNRGTIFFYGTSQPKDKEKLFDVHLVWNKVGTGGDKRGRLLATRNYDDGQCYQPNAGELSSSRATEFADQGALLEQELACQSDIKLPDDLKPGSIYTIYWYWDWPDLNTDVVDMEATSNGIFPWAGTFMRGEKDPHGFAMDAIARNESYSSVLDIKIAGVKGESVAMKNINALEWVQDQNIYSAGIEEQMKSNFQVDIDGGEQGNDGGSAPPSATVKPTSTKPADGGSGPASGVTTVTVTEICSPSATISTVYVTVPDDAAPSSKATETTSTTTLMVTKTRTASPSSVNADASTYISTSTVMKTITTTRSKSSSTADSTASTVVKTVTTHITPKPATTSEVAVDASSCQTTSTAVQTLTTDTSSRPSATAEVPISFPGGQFHETPLPASSVEATSTSSSGPPVPSGFLRSRSNWVFGDF